VVTDSIADNSNEGNWSTVAVGIESWSTACIAVARNGIESTLYIYYGSQTATPLTDNECIHVTYL